MTLADIKLAACAALWALSLAVVGFGAFMAGRSSVEQLVPENTEPAPEVRQDDGSVVLERDPKPASEPAPHKIPAGHVEERRISVHVQPDVSAAPTCECKPVRVDLSLVRDTENGRRVIASSPDGRILGGLDVPIVQTILPASRKWSAGVSYNPFDGTPGAWIERDYGRLRVGIDAESQAHRDDRYLRVRVRIGWNF